MTTFPSNPEVLVESLLAALAVCALVAISTLAPWLRRPVRRPESAEAGNPWPSSPDVAAGPRLYDHGRDYCRCGAHVATEPCYVGMGGGDWRW